jgi:hypothetical protein
MELKLSGLHISIKGARGLAFEPGIYDLRPVKLSQIAPQERKDDFARLKPGEETEIIVSLPKLPANANVRKLGATLHVREGVLFSMGTRDNLKEGSAVSGSWRQAFEDNEISLSSSNRVSVKKEGGKWLITDDESKQNYAVKEEGEKLNVYEEMDFVQSAEIQEDGQVLKDYKVSLEMPPLPRNVTLKLDGGEVFWSFAGVLKQGPHKLPDMAKHVNVYLDKLPDNTGKVALRFLMTSDGPGQVKITVAEDMEYSSIQTQTWRNALDDSIRFDRNLQLDYGMVQRIPLKPVSDQADQEISLSKIEMDIAGEFSQERLLGSVQVNGTNQFATINTDYSVAQEFQLNPEQLQAGESTAISRVEASEFAGPIRVTGITGYLKVDSETEVYIEIQSGINGSPSAEPPLAKCNLSLTPAKSDGKGHWASGSFETPADLETETPYLIVIKGITGKAQLGLRAPTEGEYLQKVLVNRGGEVWRNICPSSGTVVGMLRLIYLPGIDNQTAAIEMGVEGKPKFEPFSPGSEVQTVSLDDLTGLSQATLVIKSHAKGTLTIANVIQEYS